MRLSKDFTLEEFTESRTAKKSGIDNVPDEIQIESMKRLCNEILQPIRDYFNSPVKITSGYRSKELNELIHGAVNSQHMYGEAADITVEGVDLKEVFNVLYDMPKYGQCIYEFGSWIHISLPNSKHKNEALESKMVNGKVQYMPRKKFIL